MDETGCSLAAVPTYSWCPVKQPVCVSQRVGKPSRVNVLGALGLCGGRWHLEWQIVEGTVKTETVVAWLDALAGRASGVRPVVVVWDQASYHTAREVRERLAEWAARGMYVYLLPAYSPQFADEIHISAHFGSPPS